jgi:hypothetical protein
MSERRLAEIRHQQAQLQAGFQEAAFPILFSRLWRNADGR